MMRKPTAPRLMDAGSLLISKDFMLMSFLPYNHRQGRISKSSISKANPKSKIKNFLTPNKIIVSQRVHTIY